MDVNYPGYDGKPIQWVRIHKAPDYVYFDHSAHVNRGISCQSCHGNVNQMEVVYQAEPQSMGWCLECHRNPETHVRPKDVKATDMAWQPNEASIASAKERLTRGELNPPTHCSACHR